MVFDLFFAIFLQFFACNSFSVMLATGGYQAPAFGLQISVTEGA